jgi:hypothetical protein
MILTLHFLSGHDSCTLQKVVTDEYGTMVEWSLGEKTQINLEKNLFLEVHYESQVKLVPNHLSCDRNALAFRFSPLEMQIFFKLSTRLERSEMGNTFFHITLMTTVPWPRSQLYKLRLHGD